MSTKKLGRPRKMDDPHRYLLRLPRQYHEALLTFSLVGQTSLNDLIVAIIKEWLDRPVRRAKRRVPDQSDGVETRKPPSRPGPR